MRRKFDEPVRTILTGHCSSTVPGQFPQAHVTNVKWSTLISLVAAKNGRSCWHSPTCRSASICPPPWSPTLTTTLLTSNPSGRFSSDSSARAASKLGFSRFRRNILYIIIFSWRNLKVRLNLTYRFLQLLLISGISLQETVFPLQQLPRWSLQLRDRSGGEPYLPCTSNFLQIPHQTPRWVFKHKG